MAGRNHEKLFEHTCHIAGGENSGYGEFGWDGAADCFELCDPATGVSTAFVTHVMGWPSIRPGFHHPIRDSVCEALNA